MGRQELAKIRQSKSTLEGNGLQTFDYIGKALKEIAGYTGETASQLYVEK